jgi:hypothetical protein
MFFLFYLTLSGLVACHRRLEINKVTASKDCKSCIDSANNYCPTNELNSGFCCTPTEKCPKEDFCTLDSNLTMYEVNLF